MEHNQFHSRESIEITHNRVKRSRLYLNAFMCTFRRANAISAPRKSATREFCKHDFKMEDRRTPERDEEEFRTRRWWTKRERERERREKQKRKGRRDAWCSFSLLLLTCGIFFREYARWSRAIEDVLCIYTVVGVGVGVVVVVESSSSFTCVQREKKKLWRREEIKPFLVSSFNFFPTLISNRHFNVFLLRAYRVRRTRNRRI